MKKFLLLGLLALVIPAYAVQFAAAKHDDYVVVDTEAACPAAIEKILREQHKVPAEIVFHAAKAHVDGKDYVACWTQVGDNVALIFEDGDVGSIPVAEFHKLKDA